MRAAYLGPSGTFSQEAASLAFGDKHTPVFCASLAEVVDKVAANLADCAVLPVENSTNGIVNLAIDALLRASILKNIEICGDVKVLVKHQLFTLAPNLESVKTVYSHPQVWGQTSQWLLHNLPNAKRVDANSTAQAVKLALSDSKQEIAALGGPLSAHSRPLVANCADDPSNTTRFLILKPKTNNSSHKGRIWATTTALQAELQTQIASARLFPSFVAFIPTSKPWEYTFLLEFEGTPYPSWIVLGSELAVSKL